jgi:GcrA cell cycle regulator
VTAAVPIPWNETATSILRARWEAGDPAESIAKATGSTVAGVRKQAAKLRLSHRESFWPPERLAELKRLWSTGASFKAIGMQLGISRNAVAGARRRYDLPDRARTPTTPRNPPAERAVAVSPQRQPRCPETPERQLDPAAEPFSAGIGSVLDLKPGMCRFPQGDVRTGILFCALPTGDALEPWCPEHRRRVFVPRAPLQMKAEEITA